MVIYNTAMLVTAISECRVKKVISRTWTGTLANSADPHQTPQNTASDQGRQCLIKYKKLRLKQDSFNSLFIIIIFPAYIQDNLPISAVSALILNVLSYKLWNFNGSNPDGSFTMDESNTFLSPQGFPPNTIYG